MYKQIKDYLTNVRTDMILRVEDETYIPFDPDNTDYIAYLAWLAEGNQPEAAE